LPAILAVFSVLLFAYHGDAAHMRKHLLVSWPQENIRPNPGPDGIKDFILVHNPDIPVWKQIARPADGGNISLIWTRSPSQTLTAIGKHLQSIADNTPEFFPLQPLVFTLAILALIRAPLLPQKARWGIYCAAIWSCIWITSFLLVPDAVAYRRGVAFSTTFALLAGLSLYGANLKTKRGAAIFLLGAMIIATRFPYELSFANQDQARSRMYTICNISAPARVLLKSPILGSIDSTETVLLVARIEGERELSCQSNLANSAEWKKFRPNSRALIVEPDSVGTELKKLDPFTKIITYCSPETRKVLEIKAICDDTSQLVKSVAEIKIPNASDPLLWRVVSLRANPD
jgi:hypothetical protein